jgi:signal transduction histidine kinase
VGIWLLGRRDPDDLYGQTETALLKNIANQTAIALSHILQAETLRTLYQSNIDRQEEERKSLAHNLHDEVLNRVTELAMYVDVSSANAQFHNSYKKLSAYLRQTISGLRPAMLVYGLSEALEELVDEMAARGNPELMISFKVNSAPYRYPEKVEEHLYRILQQAAENALRYAQAHNIYIDGKLADTEISLSVVDDGIGFLLEKPVNLYTLVSQKHFGIAGMYERAALIEVKLLIDSNPGRGTMVTVTWQKT